MPGRPRGDAAEAAAHRAALADGPAPGLVRLPVLLAGLPARMRIAGDRHIYERDRLPAGARSPAGTALAPLLGAILVVRAGPRPARESLRIAAAGPLDLGDGRTIRH